MAIEKFTLHRRSLFAAAASAALGGLLGFGRREAGAHVSAQAPEATSLISAARIDGIDGGAVWSADGLSDFALPGRAHAVVRLGQSGRVMLVGRRPGTFAAIVDPSALPGSTKFISPVAHFRFAGHAAVDTDGSFVTSELHEETAEGIVVLRDGASGAARESWALGGIEPHDVLFAQDGARLVVALGGIALAAGVKGPPMNAGKIESAILELDPRSGRVLKRHALPSGMQSLSLRHLALAPDGETIVFGMQDQDRSRLRPAMGLLRLGRGIELMPLPSDDEGALRFYIGSVAIDASGCFVAATSPKGGMIGLWSLGSGGWLGGAKLADVCGLGADREAGCFWATSGYGDVMRLRALEGGLATEAHWRSDASFDNHLLRI